MQIPALVLAALTLTVFGAAAQEVTECDRLASNPFDPQRVVDAGTSYEALVPLADAAITACRAALDSDPKNLRLQYLLARSLDANSQHEEANALYLSTAEAGYGMAMNALGRAHALGTGFAADPMGAIPWYERAAEAGVFAGAANLGDMYNDGKPLPDDDPGVALGWYLKAAESDYVYALEKVGYFYATGLGTTLDYDEAFRWLDKAYVLGSGNAAKNLAVMYENGYAVEANYKRAGELYFEAVERGEVSALETYAGYAVESHTEIWRAAESLLNERGIAAVRVDGKPDRETLLALIGMVPSANRDALLAAFDAATTERVTPRP